uniref:NADH-ubiquinone oxidoreductase chain 2 n=1 Tax=Sciobius sp. SCI01 TaxID=1205648 RepID=A0A0S2MPX5_9CUCU|nr:NADH deshydrogenase subunit 2 [Sciobius sp. SCI01]
MMKFFKILFFNSMIIGSIIAISAHSWFTGWIGLEINLLSILPLLKNHKNSFPSEATIKYFIVQTLGSSLFLFAVVTQFLLKNPFNELNPPNIVFFSTAMLLKSGAAPFHFWLPEVLSGLSWMNILLIMTWQKLAPMVFLAYQIEKYTLLFSVIIISSSMISGFQGLNQTCLRKIMAYSSINHVSWMISTLLTSTNIFYYYFIIYMIINMNIIIILNKYNIFFLNQLANIFTQKKMIKFLFITNFLSLGGLPPFLGFFPKWLTINNMVINSHYTLTSILIIFTLISLFFYLRIAFSSLTLLSSESLIIIFNKKYYMHFTTNLFTLMGLVSCSFTDSFI